MSKQIKSYFTPEIEFLDKSTVKVDKNNLRERKTTGMILHFTYLE